MPYPGLGVRLREAGHEVAIAAAGSFADLVTGVGQLVRLLSEQMVACSPHR